MAVVKVKFRTSKDWKEEVFGFTQTVIENLMEDVASGSACRLFLGAISGGHQVTIPKIRSFCILLILKGEATINGKLTAKAGSSYLFYANEVVTFNDARQLVFVQVGVNYL